MREKLTTGRTSLRSTDRSTASAEASSLRALANLLLIAGPSGSGKSTLMQLLAAGKLPLELEHALPANAQAWPQRGAHVLTHIDRIGDHEGLVLHYDIVDIYQHGTDYSRDPALAPFRRAKDVTVVTIRLDAERLVSQRENRASQRAGSKSRWQLVWRRVLRQPINHLRKRLLGKAVDKLLLYRAPGWLDVCYEEWNAFVTSEAALRPLTVIEAVPVNRRGEVPEFRISTD